MNRNVVLALIGLAIAVGIGAAYLLNQQQAKINASLSPSENAATPTPTESSPTADFTEIKSAHFVSSNPTNNTVLDTEPSEIRLNFNFVLANNSSLRLFRNRTPVGTNNPTYSADKLSMTTQFPTNSGPGSYLVEYTACWPDRSCHNGSFGFIIK
jgi:methionine-rich copper-binding protein CopC